MSETTEVPPLLGDLPRWAAVAADLIPVAIIAVALEQRHAFTHPSRVLLYGAIVVLPWLLNIVGL